MAKFFRFEIDWLVKKVIAHSIDYFQFKKLK